MVCSGSLVCFGIGFRGELGFAAFRAHSGFVGLFLRDQAADALGQECAIEWFLEPVVKPEREGFLARFVAGQGEQDRAQMVGAFAEGSVRSDRLRCGPGPCR